MWPWSPVLCRRLLAPQAGGRATGSTRTFGATCEFMPNICCQPPKPRPEKHLHPSKRTIAQRHHALGKPSDNAGVPVIEAGAHQHQAPRALRNGHRGR